MHRLILAFILAVCGYGQSGFCQDPSVVFHLESVDKEVLKWMNKGHIPGLSLIMVKGDQHVIRTYGYADAAHKDPVTSKTVFELGSCSKAFTALAAVMLADEGRFRLDDAAARYIPWLRVTYKGKDTQITIRQLLHHTSGIAWGTISSIPQGAGPDALEMTVRQLTGLALKHRPGSQYEYATINYDVVALIIQYVTGMPFESYVKAHLLSSLQLYHTDIGKPADGLQPSAGYKIGFFKARQYDAPRFRGNNAAGYFTSDAEDIARWLTFNMGLSGSSLYRLADSTHKRDETVGLHDMSSYAMGWQVSLSGNGEIYHDGYNPNFTSYLAFRPKEKLGVAILANSNSNFTVFAGDRIIRLLAGNEQKKEYDPGDGNDRAYSVVAITAGCYLLAVMAVLVKIILDIFKKRRGYDAFTWRKVRKMVYLLAALLPFMLGLYILPRALTNFTWEALLVWSPISLPAAVIVILVSVCLSYLTYAVGLFYPGKDKLRRIAPRLVLLSVLSGLANMMMIILITSSLDSTVELKWLIFYFILAFSVYIFGRRYVQVSLIRFSRELTFDMRIEMIGKIFSTSYQKFEKIDRGRVYTALNDDLVTIGDSATMLITLVSSCITAIGAFVFLATIAFWSTILTLCLIGILLTLCYFVSKSTNIHFEKARDTQNLFMRLTNGMIDGFKEISLHRNKKLEYRADIAACAGEFKERITHASIRFVDVNLTGESVLIVSLGMVAFAFPKLFPDIPSYTIMNFIIILLYLVAPVGGLLGAVPGILRLRIAWRRIREFLKEIPATMELTAIAPVLPVVTSFKANGLTFRYKSEERPFMVGPINLEVRSGEVIFIIGGNGSGKSTLGKLLTGLYEPDEGEILINNRRVDASRLGEHFSAVFSPLYLFEKLYNVTLDDKQEDLHHYLELLDLREKVTITDRRYSTLNLSGGQRKRLALLQCYLEDADIYLFDEWASDQDPEYRKFFYRTLLPAMKRKGKLVIAITHDDHYFDMADRILKMDQGQLVDHSDQYAAVSDPAGSAI
jgi:putative ATP-binding cassette transporter